MKSRLCFSMIFLAFLSKGCGSTKDQENSTLMSPDPKIYVIDTDKPGRYKLGAFTQGGSEENGKWVAEMEGSLLNKDKRFYTFGPYLNFPGVGHVNGQVKLKLSAYNSFFLNVPGRRGGSYNTLEECQASVTPQARGYCQKLSVSVCVDVDLVANGGTWTLSKHEVCGEGDHDIKLPGTIFENGINELEARVYHLKTSGHCSMGTSGGGCSPMRVRVEIDEIRFFGNWIDPEE